MLITIDTNKLTDEDKEILSYVMQGKSAVRPTENDTAAEPPKRTRRTKAQIEADRIEAEKAAAETTPEEQAEGPTEREVQEALGTTNALSVEEFSNLCSELIAKNRDAFKGLLDEFEVKRATLVPDERRAEFIDAVRAKLA